MPAPPPFRGLLHLSEAGCCQRRGCAFCVIIVCIAVHTYTGTRTWPLVTSHPGTAGGKTKGGHEIETASGEHDRMKGATSDGSQASVSRQGRRRPRQPVPRTRRVEVTPTGEEYTVIEAAARRAGLARRAYIAQHAARTAGPHRSHVSFMALSVPAQRHGWRAICQADLDSELAHPAHPLGGRVGVIAELLRHLAGAAIGSEPLHGAGDRLGDHVGSRVI